MTPAPITIAILAMGGEGGGVLADWLVDLAEHSGYLAQTTSVPGVAQRTGSTIYYLEIFPDANGPEPVLALMPVPGHVDIVIASELMEAGRAIQRGLVTPDRTTLIASSHRVYSMTERTATGDARVDSGALLKACTEAAKNFVCADFAAIARDSGSVISASLFGALAVAGTLPFAVAAFEDAIRRGGVGVDASLRAFHAASNGHTRTRSEAAAKPVMDAAVDRLTDYQDTQYADEFRARLGGIHDPELLTETARYLALWMSYEDAIRVAQLKIRAARLQRIRGKDQFVKVHDYVFPRLQEIADILPAGLGHWLLATRWARALVERLTRHGQVIETTSIRGFLRLYLVAALRPWRRKSLRFRREQQNIDKWLAAVKRAAKEDLELARQIAEAPRLIKGYGETHEHGVREFDDRMRELLDHLPKGV